MSGVDNGQQVLSAQSPLARTRIVLCSSLCQLAFHCVSLIFFCQCGHLSHFCRVVFLPRKIRHHVEQCAPHLQVLQALFFDKFGFVEFCACVRLSRPGSLTVRPDSFSVV